MACRTAARILVHYMINGRFLGAGGAANRDNNYILDQIARLRDIPVHVVHGRYDRVCHVYQAEALLRALRDAGNNAVSYCLSGPRAGKGAVHEQFGADGGRADQPRRTRLRHLIAAVEGADHLPGRADPRRRRQPHVRPAVVSRGGKPEQGHQFLHQLAGRVVSSGLAIYDTMQYIRSPG
jgi:hypothetical protein